MLRRLDIDLAYDPLYLSESHPIERCRGFLELTWDGSLLDSVGEVSDDAEPMRWEGGPRVLTSPK